MKIKKKKFLKKCAPIIKLKNLKWKIIIKIIKKIPYDSRQKHFTTYPNFQEFVNAKKVICKCGQIISLGVNYQVFGQSYYVLWKMWARTFMGRKANRILDHLSYISIFLYRNGIFHVKFGRKRHYNSYYTMRSSLFFGNTFLF